MNVSVKGLSVSYDRKPVLNNVFLELAEGQLYGILGPNGAGKSTLFKALLGLISPDKGVIDFGGKKVEDVRKQVVYIPQKSDVDWTFPATVEDIVLMGRYPHISMFERINKQDRAIAATAMKDIGISHLRDRQIGQLSGGQQQRAFLARAIAQEADVFFFDEPFVGVDIVTEQKIIEILKALTLEGKTVLVIHHDLSKVREYFDYTILLNQRIVAAGPTEDVFTDEHIAQTYGGQLTLLNKADH